jgi:hypothetical protein
MTRKQREKLTKAFAVLAILALVISSLASFFALFL